MSDLMREEFSKWLMDVYGLESEWQEERNCFKDFTAHLAYQAWQASRGRLVIELPKPYAWDNDGGFDLESDPDSECSMALIPTIDVMQSIHAAGVKTK